MVRKLNIETNAVIPQNQLSFKANSKDLKKAYEALDISAFHMPLKLRDLSEDGRKKVKKNCI